MIWRDTISLYVLCVLMLASLSLEGEIKGRVATVREKRFVFFQGQGILHQVREILNSLLKSVKSQGILFSGCHKL